MGAVLLKIVERYSRGLPWQYVRTTRQHDLSHIVKMFAVVLP